MLAPRVGIKLPLWSTLFTVWSMQAVAGKEGGEDKNVVWGVTTIILHKSIMIL